MLSRLNSKNLKAICLGIISVMLMGCQDTIPNRALIDDSALTTGGTTGGAEPTPLVRPTDAVKFKTNFCGCKDGKAITYGNCGVYCASKSTNGEGILFADFTVTEAISLNTKFNDLNGWCNNALPDEDANPRCLLQATDDTGTIIKLDVAIGSTA